MDSTGVEELIDDHNALHNLKRMKMVAATEGDPAAVH